MARKKKPKPLRASSMVKAMSRAVLGAPPPVKRKESRKRTAQEKHKPTMGRLLGEAE